MCRLFGSPKIYPRNAQECCADPANLCLFLQIRLPDRLDNLIRWHKGLNKLRKLFENCDGTDLIPLQFEFSQNLSRGCDSLTGSTAAAWKSRPSFWVRMSSSCPRATCQYSFKVLLQPEEIFPFPVDRRLSVVVGYVCSGL